MGDHAGTGPSTPPASPREQLPATLAGQVARLLDFLSVERGLSRNTLEAYGRDLLRYAAFLASRGITDATAADEATIFAFVGHLSGIEYAEGLRYRASSVARALAAVRSLHSFLLREGEATDDPSAGVTRPKVPRTLPRPIAFSMHIGGPSHSGTHRRASPTAMSCLACPKLVSTSTALPAHAGR